MMHIENSGFSEELVRQQMRGEYLQVGGVESNRLSGSIRTV